MIWIFLSRQFGCDIMGFSVSGKIKLKIKMHRFGLLMSFHGFSAAFADYSLKLKMIG